MKDGQAQAAIDEFQQALTLDSRDAAANLNIARCYLTLNDPERSYQFARQAMAIDPTMLAAHRVLGRTLLIEGRTAEAVAELEKAAPSDRDGSALLFRLSMSVVVSKPSREVAAGRE